MATVVKLPQWGMNMESGLLVKWLISEGDSVDKGQPLVEIETAKINSELESPESGIIAHIMVPEGETVDVGTIVAVISEPGETVTRPQQEEKVRASKRSLSRNSSDQNSKTQKTSRKQATPVARKMAKSAGIPLENINGSGPNGRITEEDIRLALQRSEDVKEKSKVQIVPKARQIAKLNAIDTDLVEGTGPAGRITVADIESFIKVRANQQASVLPVKEIIPIQGIRKAISDKMMLGANSAAPVTLTTKIDMSETIKEKKKLTTSWRKHKLSPMDIDIISYITALTLSDHPLLNAVLENNQIQIIDRIDLGIAVALDNGLIVPVVRKADQKDLITLAKEIRDLSSRAKKGSLEVDEVTGSSFTVTSLSNHCIDAFTPIINSPEVAILGLGRISLEPAAYQEKVTLRDMMTVSLTFDHRAIDGVIASKFLDDLKHNLETFSS